MRIALALALALLTFGAHAADDPLQELVARAAREQKPLVVFFRTAGCELCDEFERTTAVHPTIERRLPKVIIATLPIAKGDPHVAYIDRAGAIRVQWPFVPEAMNFGVLLDSIIAVAPYFDRAVALTQSGAPYDGDLEAAIGYARIGRMSDARAALERARTNGSDETKRRAEAILRAPAENSAPRPADTRAIRVLPLGRQVVSGHLPVRTHVASASIAHVAFAIDGREVARVATPPFSATLDFGTVPERHTIRVIAFDRKNREIGRDERIVNDAGEIFWLRLTEPREGPAVGTTRVSMSVRVPSLRRVQRVVISWNDARRAVLTQAPWETTVDIPREQVGVLRAVAELDDGRTSEDAVLLNASGASGHSNVQLVELPLTIVSRDGSTPELTPKNIRVREGNITRPVESIATAEETPLTIGMLIDVSDSMQRTLPDVQEAAIRFLETILTERDRAFIITFSDGARLLQPATSDVAQLRRQIMTTTPDGLTALNDAIILGLLQFEGIKGRRAMVVFSDGGDVTSRYSSDDVRELARRVNVPIHVIASIEDTPAALKADAQPRIYRSLSDWELATGNLRRVAAATGGMTQVLDNLANLRVVYALIESALRSQILAFVRTDGATKENDWRAVRVDVEGQQQLDVFAPEGYYAVW